MFPNPQMETYAQKMTEPSRTMQISVEHHVVASPGSPNNTFYA